MFDIVANIKNGLILNKKYILQRKKKKYKEFLNLLWDEGFILGYQNAKFNPNYYIIYLRYDSLNNPVINSIFMMSKPGYRKYYSVKQLWKINSSKFLVMISTSYNGVLSLQSCKKLNIGGEIIAIVK
jgi:ribosomal protein S8